MPRPSQTGSEWIVAERQRLLALAYRMLGSANDAEDVVQEALVRWHQADQVSLANPAAWLTTTVTRLAIDQLRSARRREYRGPWLPEPWPTLAAPPPDEPLALAETLSLAMLVLMESLDPVERAVFLLREAFGYDYAEIARIVDRGEANCRQLFHRAKEHLVQGRPRPLPPVEEQERLTTAFLSACSTGDVQALSQLLAAEVVAWSDGGGAVPAALVPIEGRAAVIRYLLGVTKKGLAGAAFRDAHLNGQQALVFYHDGQPTNVVFLEWREGQVSAIRTIRNPAKLAHLPAMTPQLGG